MGLALVRQGRFEEAINHFLEDLRINPGHAKAHYNLGLAMVPIRISSSARADTGNRKATLNKQLPNSLTIFFMGNHLKPASIQPGGQTAWSACLETFPKPSGAIRLAAPESFETTPEQREGLKTPLVQFALTASLFLCNISWHRCAAVRRDRL